MKKFFASILLATFSVLSLICLCFEQTSMAQGVRPSGFFADGVGSGDPNATYLTLSNGIINNNNRIFAPNATRFSVVDGGAKGNYVLDLNTVAIGFGGTGQTTAQLGFNALADGTAGAAATSGDILYRAGTNWTRLPKGTNGQYLWLASGIPAWNTAPAGAPTTSSYLTLGADAGLSAERVLTQGTGILLTDGGANSTLTVAIDSTVVTKTGVQTLTNKTLTAPTINAANTTGYILSGTTFSDTILIADPAAARNITIPDPGTNANFVLSEAAATINGVKTFTAANIVRMANTGLTIDNPAGTFTVNIKPSAEVASRTATIPLMGGNDTFGMLGVTQTWSGINTFSNAIAIGSGGTGTNTLAGHGVITSNSGGTALTSVAPGTTGNALVSNGTDWVSGTVSASVKYTLSAKAGSYAVSGAASGTYFRNSATGTITLPASPADGTVYKFKQTSGTGTFAFNGAETVNHANGVSNQSLTQTNNVGVIELVAVSGGWDET